MKQSILSHVYPNGLVLIAEPMPSVESAAFTIRIPAGTAWEPAERGGLSAMVCELALRGAGPRDNRSFVNDLDNLGVERGEGVADAHVSFRGATLSKNLHDALAIYADVLRRPHLPEDQLEAGRLAALQELAGVEDEPAQKVMLELRRRHFPDPWGRLSQGRREALNTIGIEEIRGFFGRSYRPNGTILGVAGKVDWPALVEHVGLLLADWRPLPAPAIEEREAPPGHEHLPHDSNQTQIGIAYRSVPYRDPDYYQAAAAVGVLSGGMSSRLFTEVREKRGLCYSVYASHSTLLDRGCVFCYAGTSAERAQQTLDVTLAEIVRLSDGIESAELERLKARIKSGQIMQQESSSARSAALARDWYYLGRARTLDEVSAIVDALSPESINAYLAGHRPSDFTIVTLGPKPLEVPVGVS
ncbi:MAG TPA: pitrilysin family protein [Pirellulales bacterium]|nr:pitrilysin family protein [Pirellulales bacterium]